MYYLANFGGCLNDHNKPFKSTLFSVLSSSISSAITEVSKTSSDIDALLNSTDIDDSTKTTLTTLQALLTTLATTLSSFYGTFSTSSRLYRNTKGYRKNNW